MRLILFIFLFVAVNISLAQKDEVTGLYEEFDSVFLQASDNEKLNANSEFKKRFIDYLRSQPKIAMNHGFDGLRMFKGMAPDGSFRIFNWNIPLQNKNHYECLFIRSVDGIINIIECKKNIAEISQLITKNADHTRWPAALYFDIIPINKKKKNQFVLLGWDGNDELTNRKVIEVITVGKKSIKFGAPIFRDYMKRARRIVFEYSDEVTMSLSHDKKFKRLVFDHLAPSSQNLVGKFEFYGPDMTFDCFVIKKGLLYYRENISFERGKNYKDKQFSDPRR